METRNIKIDLETAKNGIKKKDWKNSIDNF